MAGAHGSRRLFQNFFHIHICDHARAVGLDHKRCRGTDHGGVAKLVPANTGYGPSRL